MLGLNKCRQTLGTNFAVFASICEWAIATLGEPLEGVLTGDACYYGMNYKYHRGTYPAAYRQTWLYRVQELNYNAKGGHNRRTKFGGTESYQNYGEFLEESCQRGSTLFLDGCAMGRSKLLNAYFRVESCNHKLGQFTRPDTLHKNRLGHVGCNPIEQSWRKERNSKRKRAGTGRRVGFNHDAEIEIGQNLWCKVGDWEHIFTNRKATNRATVLLNQFALLFPYEPYI